MSSKNVSSLFKHQTEHNQDILNLLEKTIIGTNGARYRHLHTARKIGDLVKPNYFTIYRKGNAIANITICERDLFINGKLTDTFYIRYFAFDSNFQTKGRAKKKEKPSYFQTAVSELLDTSNLNVNEPQYKPMIYWAIVDPENSRSLQMIERYGFETISKIKTTAFSRFRPGEKPTVSRATKLDETEIWQQTQQFYKRYNSLSNTHLFKNDNYFILKENGKIIAGIQANEVEWKIEALPGTIGKLLVKTLPYVPYIRRIINPKKYQFLATEGLFWLPGYQNKVATLLEGVLYIQKCHSMLLWTDSKDLKLNQTFKSIKLGWLQKLKTDNAVNLVAKFNKTPEKTIDTMKNQLHYISGFDCT